MGYKGLIDLAIAIVALEIVGLMIWRSRAKGGMRPLDILGQLLAGGLLLVAVRLEAGGVDRRVTLILLALSFPAHLYDLQRRLRQADAASKR